MKTLSLYIDRWYIAAAVCSSGILRHLEYPNREDRIWLYFYQDVINDKVVYGKKFRKKFLDREPGYIGDIFEKIVSNYATFTRFGVDQSIKEIFKACGIIENFEKEFSDNEQRIVYISFSLDVSYAAQKVFIEILQFNGFIVKESVARISHLALEYTKKTGRLEPSNYILILTASNENLSYCVHKYMNDRFIRKGNDGVLKGYGTDLRGRALLEQIVKQINQNSRLLSKDEEEYEINRLYQNIDRYLSHFDEAKPNFPVVYSNITFSRAPHNAQRVHILKREIEERTNAIVENVIDKIISYVREIGVDPVNLTHVVFLGNSLRNPMFKDALLNRFTIAPEAIIHYNDLELPEIVSIYNQIDLSQFEIESKNIENLSAEELEHLRIAEEEKNRREKADKEQFDKNEAFKAEKEALAKFHEIMNEVEVFLKRSEYSRAIDLLEIALLHKPDDKDAKELLEEVKRKLSELNIISEKYNKAIALAAELFKKALWSEALAKCQIALELRPDSKEALKIKHETEKKIKLEESVRDFLLRADTFIGQKLYDQALIELNKAMHADANNEEIALRISKIEQEKKERLDKILLMEKELVKWVEQGAYDKAIKLCDKLLDFDSSNQKKWNEKRLLLISEYNELKNREKNLLDLREKINNATFHDEWALLVDLCNRFLKIESDENITRLLEKAMMKNDEIVRKNELDSRVSLIKALIADKQWGEARENTKKFELDYPECKPTVKSLFRQIFEAEEFAGREYPKDQRIESAPSNSSDERPVIGFKPPVQKKGRPAADFFDDNPDEKQKGRDSVSKPERPKVDHNKNDFFDLDSKVIKGSKDKSSKRIITNNDFDF